MSDRVFACSHNFGSRVALVGLRLVQNGTYPAAPCRSQRWQLVDRTMSMDGHDLSTAAQSSLFICLVRRRWTVDVVALLAQGGRRYQEIHDALDGVSYKVLTETLRRAERDGIVSRRLAPDRVDPKVRS